MKNKFVKRHQSQLNSTWRKKIQKEVKDYSDQDLDMLAILLANTPRGMSWQGKIEAEVVSAELKSRKEVHCGQGQAQAVSHRP